MGYHLDRYGGSAASTEAPAAGAPGKVPITARLARRPAASLTGEPRDGNGVAAGADALVQQASAASGAPLPGDVRGRFEASLGADLSAVRVHTGPDSARAAAAVGARAYTTGNDVHFGAGQYASEDPFGLHLLAHEVAHTVQQAGAAPTLQPKLEVSAPGDAAEVEADAIADALVAGGDARSIVRTAIPARAIARAPLDESAKDADDNGEVFEFRDALIKGSLKDAGAWKDGHFANATLQTALEFYGARWSVSVAAPVAPAAPAAAVPADAPAKKPSLADFPPWFAAFQTKLIKRSQWKKDEQAVSALLEAFVRARFPDAPDVAKAFFHHLGESVGNTGVDNLKVGARKADGKQAYQFCAAASSKMLEEALAKHGLAFKGGGYGAYYAKHKKNIQVGGAAAFTAPLAPGDRVTVVTNDSALSGHVITVLNFEDPVITFVSGNSTGGSVQLESARRTQPPPSYQFYSQASAANVDVYKAQLDTMKADETAGKKVNKQAMEALKVEYDNGVAAVAKGLPKNHKDPHFVAGTHAPAGPGEAWTTVIEKVSLLDPASLEGKPDAELDKLGLKKIPVTA